MQQVLRPLCPARKEMRVIFRPKSLHCLFFGQFRAVDASFACC